MNWKHIWISLRPWSFTASLTPVILGSVLALRLNHSCDIVVLLAVSITAISVHAAGNLVNTYYDFIRGVDNQRSDDTTLVEGRLSVNDVATFGTIAYAIGCIGLLVLCMISPAPVEHLALVYFCGLSGSFLYTGGLGLKYLALGDIVVFLTFGPLTVLFAYLAQTGQFSQIAFWYATPLALNIECVLHANNCRDRIEDNKAGIITLAILIGETWSYALFCILLFGPFIAFGYISFHFSPYFILPTLAIVPAFAIEREYRSKSMAQLPRKIANLNLILGSAYILAILLTPEPSLPMAPY